MLDLLEVLDFVLTPWLWRKGRRMARGGREPTTASVAIQLLIFVGLMLAAVGIVAVLLWRSGLAFPGP